MRCPSCGNMCSEGTQTCPCCGYAFPYSAPKGFHRPDPYRPSAYPAPEPKMDNYVPMVLGMLGLVMNLLLGCFCAFFGILPGTVCSVIGLVLANKARKTYAAGGKEKEVEIGFILSILGLVVGALWLIFYLVIILVIGSQYQ